MHYKNGTEAKDGDAVIAKDYTGTVRAGTLHGLQAKNTTCNGTVAFPMPGGCQQHSVTIGEIYSAADAFAALEAKSNPPA